ncbi:2-dehydro-3-deoxygalactonokinase [Amaricoccus macauensis]|uniref:2-dehydro-3-deoxygalactonokinase n=1 Tax=Amaricoccus macauensis TaxID=57001 RepID=UPI003C7B3213
MGDAHVMPDWVAVDWGTSHLRVWLMARSGKVLAGLTSEKGMGRLPRDGFEPTLVELLGPHLPASGRLPVIVCGMAGSRQGWAEAPYAAVPCKPPSLAQATRVTCSDPRLEVFILPGVKQMKPADVMRGEETQIAGLLADKPGFDGVICLPGTHTKWAHISAGEIVSFRTFMTGEMFELLSARSVLRHSIADAGWDDAAFSEAVDDAISRPADMAGGLFALRAGALLADLAPQTARARLSGLLIGAELAAARPYWLGQEVRIIGATGLASAYLAALKAQGAAADVVPGDEITLRGLTAAFHEFEEIQS